MIPIKAYVLITAEAPEMKNALQKMRASKAVQSAEAVTGPFDIIATLEAEDVNAMGKLVTQEILAIGGIQRTLTCIVIDL